MFIANFYILLQYILLVLELYYIFLSFLYALYDLMIFLVFLIFWKWLMGFSWLLCWVLIGLLVLAGKDIVFWLLRFEMGGQSEKWVLMVTAQTPTNIAVIKYWGKRDEKLILPINDSISVTLDPDHLCTTTTVAVSPGFDQDRMWLNGKVRLLNYQSGCFKILFSCCVCNLLQDYLVTLMFLLGLSCIWFRICFLYM